MTIFTRESLIEIQTELWKSISYFCCELNPGDWGQPTNCPNWTVKDCLSHLIGIESRLMGDAAPEIEIGDLEHVKNSQGFSNEVDVISRRFRSSDILLEEFANVTTRRLRYLRSEKDFSIEAESPVGPGSLLDQVSVRIFDGWVHFQDMRMGVGVPCDFASEAADLSLGRMYSVMPFVVGKKAGATDGTTVLFEVCEDEQVVQKFVHVRGGRASHVTTSENYSVAISCSQYAFFMLTCGRIDPLRALKRRMVDLRGDTLLGERIVSEMNFMI